MIPAYARIAHKKLRAKLHDIEKFNETSEFVKEINKNYELGIITSGISYAHCLDAAPEASILKIGLTYPLPIERMKAFAAKVKRCVVVEEGDPILFEACRVNGINAEGKDEMYRFGELNVNRIRRILNNDTSAEAQPPAGKPPQLCIGCPHRKAYETLRDLSCIVTGDIGCYTLGVLPPFEAVDTCVCMGASIGTGLGMRHVLSEAEARRVVSVIGDSTFMHTGVNGIVEMVYNRPKTGHVVLILDNSTTAMTGLQEHPGTGRKLDHTPAPKIIIEDMIKAMGVDNVDICDPTKDQAGFEELLKTRLASNDLSVIIARRPCILAAVKVKKYEAQCGGN
jgi:indolepyruvate ferredoxin oxidoreductase alpha subunit